MGFYSAIKNAVKGLRIQFRVKSTCSRLREISVTVQSTDIYKGPWFDSQHPYAAQNLSITTVPRDLVPLSCLSRHQTHTCRQNIHIKYK